MFTSGCYDKNMKKYLSVISIVLFFIMFISVPFVIMNSSFMYSNDERSYHESESSVDPFEKAENALSDKGIKWKDLVWFSDQDQKEEEKLKRKTPSKILKIVDREVELAGYMFSLNWDKESMTEFLLMAFRPTCMHAPMPPADQIIFVKSSSPVNFTFSPVILTGKIRVDHARVKVSGEVENHIVKNTETVYRMDATKFKKML